jgi:hypothetical protein
VRDRLAKAQAPDVAGELSGDPIRHHRPDQRYRSARRQPSGGSGWTLVRKESY